MDADAQAAVTASELEGNLKVQEHMRRMQELGVFKLARPSMPPSARRRSLRSAHAHAHPSPPRGGDDPAPGSGPAALAPARGPATRGSHQHHARSPAAAWSWEDDDNSNHSNDSNDSFSDQPRHQPAPGARPGTRASSSESPGAGGAHDGHRRHRRDAGARASASAWASPAGPAFVKLIQPAHVSGAYWVPAPYGLADFLPASSCAVTLTCDGEEWRVSWVVRSANSPGALGGGWRGFAVDQRLAPGDALCLTKEPGLRLRVTVHRHARAGDERRRSGVHSATSSIPGGRPHAAQHHARGARTNPNPSSSSSLHHNPNAASSFWSAASFITSSATKAAFAEAASHTDAVFAHHGAKPGAAVTGLGAVPDPLPGNGTARETHVYSRRRLGRTDDAAVDDARRRAGADPETVAEMARSAAVGVSRRAVVPPPDTTADDDAKASAAAPPFASPAMPAMRTRAAPADRRAGAERREETTVETLPASAALRTAAAASPASTPAPPPTAARASALELAARLANKAPLRAGEARRRETTPCPIAETPGETPGGEPSSAPRGGVGPAKTAKRESPGSVARRGTGDAVEGRGGGAAGGGGGATSRRGPRRQTPTHVSFVTGAAQFEGWTTPAPAKAGGGGGGVSGGGGGGAGAGSAARTGAAPPASEPAGTPKGGARTFEPFQPVQTFPSPPPAPGRPATRGRRTTLATKLGTPTSAGGANPGGGGTVGTVGTVGTPDGTPLSRVFRCTKRREGEERFDSAERGERAATKGGVAGAPGSAFVTPVPAGVKKRARADGGEGEAGEGARRVSRYWKRGE